LIVAFLKQRDRCLIVMPGPELAHRSHQIRLWSGDGLPGQARQ
jgi:hypothetical protein